MPRTLFTHANLLDGENPPRPEMNVALEGNRITSVSDQPPDPSAHERVIDLAGKTLMPGMWQGHFHSGFGAFGGRLVTTG